MLGRRFLVKGRRWIRAVPWKGVAGVAVATPLIAVVQGTVLLQEYRRNHLHQPCPDIPSRGLVVVRSNDGVENVRVDETLRFAHGDDTPMEHRARIHDNHSSPVKYKRHATGRIVEGTPSDESVLATTTAPPLRILVIGDSLAAGVGTSRQGTPVLPEAVAQALSRALDGRAVLWTCLGVPGQTASETVHDIHHLDDAFFATSLPSLLRQWDEWQAVQRAKAMERIEAAKQRTQEWLDYCKQQRLPDEQKAKWWKRISVQMRRDADALRRIALRTDPAAPVPAHDSAADPTPLTLTDAVGPYDVAIVLTGCNDLKESYLPFMMKARSRSPSTDANHTVRSDSDAASERGIKGELLRILHALESKMIQRIILPTPVLESQLDRNDPRGPLIVFPAMPFEATTLGQRFPLSLFVTPLLQMIDRHKQMLSERYPGRVLYVPSPDSTTWSDFEAKRGPQWQDFNVLLKLNGIAQDAKEHIEQLMQRHYARWVLDDDELETSGSAHDIEFGDSTYKIDDVEGMWTRTTTVANGVPRRLGNKLVAPDGIHPSDSGYDMWGRHIASAIVQEWDRQTQCSETAVAAVVTRPAAP